MARPVFLAGIPTAGFLDPDSGDITPAWRAFLLSLWRRTGGAVGVSSDTSQIEADLAAETTARIAGDAALGADIVAERAARESADATLTAGLSAEAQTRAAVDAALAARTTTSVDALAAETRARIAADALLVPIAQLCSMWAACDLSFLPTSDPGSGKPWLDGNHIAIGTPAAATVGIGLEDVSGRWGLENGTGAWIWG